MGCECLHRTSCEGIPLIDPPLDRVPVADIIFDRHSDEGLTPLSVPLAVFVQRIKNLPQELVVLTKRYVAQILHEEFVCEGLENQVESDEGLRPIVDDEQLLNDFTERLP
jgi:hypothetical protein